MTVLLVLRIVALAAALATAGDGRLQRAAVVIAGKVHSIAPAGWSMRAEGLEVILERNEPVLFWNDVNNPGILYIGRDREWQEWVESHGRFEKLRIVFRLAPRITSDEYRRVERRLRGLRKRARYLESALEKMGTNHKFDSYVAETAEEKSLVKEYESVKAEVQRVTASLPSASTREASIFISDNGPATARAIYGEKTSAECHDVLRKAYGLFRAPRP